MSDLMKKPDFGPPEVVVNDVRYVREETLFAAMARVEELEEEVARKTPPHPDAVPQWGTDDWREWARRARTSNSHSQ